MADFLAKTSLASLVFDLRGNLLYGNTSAYDSGLASSLKQELFEAAMPNSQTCKSIFHYAGISFTACLDKPRDQLLIVAHDVRTFTENQGFPQVSQPSQVGSSDWQRDPRHSTLFSLRGEMADRIREFDWASTELGHLNLWPQARLEVLSFVLKSQLGMMTYLGQDNIVIYNDAFIQRLGPSKHPNSLGQPAKKVWKESWRDIQEKLESAQQGQGHAEKEFRMLWHRLQDQPNPLEEVWCEWYYVPFEWQNEVVATIHILVESRSNHPVLLRRNHAASQIGATLANCRDSIELCRKACVALSSLPYDTPYVLAYTCAPAEFQQEDTNVRPYVRISTAGTTTSGDSSLCDMWSFDLQDTVGLDFDTPASPSKITISTKAKRPLEDGIWSAAFHRMMATRKMVEIEGSGNMFKGVPPRGLEGIHPFRALCVPLLHRNRVYGMCHSIPSLYGTLNFKLRCLCLLLGAYATMGHSISSLHQCGNQSTVAQLVNGLVDRRRDKKSRRGRGPRPGKDIILHFSVA